MMAMLRCVLLLFVGLLAACGSPLVGGECLPEYAICDHACVDLDTDFRNCGACGNDCGAYVCDEGVCTDRLRMPDGPDSTMPDATMDGEMPDADIDAGPDGGDAEPPDADTGFDADTGLPGCGVGVLACGAECVDTNTDVRHCGDCDSPCVSGEVCTAGVCEPACPVGQTECASGCFDTDSDARHCGGCGVVCASGICESGECADSIPGHVVLVGHTYEISNRFQSTLLGNAVFLGRGAPVRTLVYEGSARAASVSGVNTAVDMVAQSIGRQWVVTPAVESLVTLQLGAADVFLIHAQAQSSDSVLEKLGQEWGMAIAEFLVRGGVVVLIEGASAENSGTFQLLEPSAAFRAGGRTALSGMDVEVVEPGTGIAIRVGDRYRGERGTVGFDAVETPGVVVSKVGDRPVIFQRVIH